MNPTIHVVRDQFGSNPSGVQTTLGIVAWEGLPFGYSCEDEDRGLQSTMPIEEIRRIKIPHLTCIPTGLYRVQMHPSVKHGREVPWILNVPGFQYIQIHPGNTAGDTDGCLLPGTRRDISRMVITHSRPACDWLYTQIEKMEADGKPVTILIQRDESAFQMYRAHRGLGGA